MLVNMISIIFIEVDKHLILLQNTPSKKWGNEFWRLETYSWFEYLLHSVGKPKNRWN